MGDTFSLSASEIVYIIRECRKLGVEELQVGPLRAIFGGQAEKKFTKSKPDKAVSVKQKEIEKKSILADEIDLRDRQIAEMLLEDPLKAEEMIAAGELKDITDDAESDG